MHLVYLRLLDQYQPPPQAPASSAPPHPTQSLTFSWTLNILSTPPHHLHYFGPAPGPVPGPGSAGTLADSLRTKEPDVDSA